MMRFCLWDNVVAKMWLHWSVNSYHMVFEWYSGVY